MQQVKPCDLVLAHASEIETERVLFERIEPILRRACTVRAVTGDHAQLTTFPERAGETPIAVPINLLLSVHNDVVPKKEEQRRALVYLDQCVLSELVKFKAGRLKKAAHAAAASDLLAALDEAVFEKQTAVCVELSFHRQEASGLAQGTRRPNDLQQTAFEFLCLRSRHLRLLDHRQILRNQALQRIALAANGRVHSAKYLWKTGLSHDPEETNAKTGMFGGTVVIGVPWGPVDPAPALAIGLERERAEGRFDDFASEMDACKRSWRTEAQESRRWRWRPEEQEEETCGISSKSMDEFLASEAFFDLPYAACAVTLTASLLSEKNRKFRDSDYVDMRFVARALPYCDLMVLDADLANRVRSTKLDQRFSTKVLSAKLAGHGEAAEWLRARSNRSQT